MSRQLILFSFLCVLPLIVLVSATPASVEFVNSANVALGVWWRNEDTGSYKLLATVESQDRVRFNTFLDHRFLVKPLGKDPDLDDPNYVQDETEQVRVSTRNTSLHVGICSVEKGRRTPGKW